MDESSVTVVGDWTPTPSPRTFISNFLDEEFGARSFSDFLAENGSEEPPLDSERNKEVKRPKEEAEGGDQFQHGLSTEIVSLDSQKSGLRGGLAERMAARAGFNAPKLNTARIRSANMDSSSSEIRSPYLTIPPGLSPTMLLDSPVFLCNSMAQSPTTGKFLFGQGNNNNFLPEADFFPDSFAFKPHVDSNSGYFSSAESKDATAVNHHQPLQSIKGPPTQSENPGTFQNQHDFNFQTAFSVSSERKDATTDIVLNQRVSDSFTGSEQSPPLDDQPDGEADTKEEFSSVATGTPAEDGYNWRKYGQKQVKGSEFPRSYYKCTQPNCQVRKKVERSHEGHITEIIYKGAHNHPKPPPNRRSTVASQPFNEVQNDGSEHTGSQCGFEGKPSLASLQNGTGGIDWRADGFEASSASAAELCDPSTSVQTQDGSRMETHDAIDVSSTPSNDEDDDDRATHGSASLVVEGEGDETESKRRKLDTCTVDMSAASRAVREPRVVVQTTSEVDILDDGYRWRKYGQKVVKGNPNPRSYYKCTYQGCTVRKHVERASNDLKSVITTYEGKHNHEVPAARNSGSQASSQPSSTSGASVASQAQQFPRRPELTRDSLMRMAPLGSFAIPGRETMGHESGFGFGMPQQALTEFGITGLGCVAPLKMPVLPPVHPFMMHRQATEAGFVIPKGEPKEEAMAHGGLPPMSTNDSSSVYQQMMGRLPLGPQL